MKRNQECTFLVTKETKQRQVTASKQTKPLLYQSVVYNGFKKL